MHQISGLIIFFALVATGVFLVSEETIESSLPFTVLAQGAHAKVDTRVNYLITSEEGLVELWKLLDVDTSMPTVDFSSRSVIAVFSGERATGGHLIAVSKIEDGSSRAVTVTRTIPGESCMTTEALSTPYQIVDVPVTTLPMTHTNVLVVAECE